MIRRRFSIVVSLAAVIFATAACGVREETAAQPPTLEANAPAQPDTTQPVASGNTPAAADVAAAAGLRAGFDPSRVPVRDLETAKVEAVRGNRRIILDVGGEWCERCHALDDLVDGDSTLRSLRDAGFVWVKVSVSEENRNAQFLTRFPPITRHPHLLVLDAQGRLLHSQDTEALEEGDGFSVERIAAFLEEWTSAAALEQAQPSAANAG